MTFKAAGNAEKLNLARLGSDFGSLSGFLIIILLVRTVSVKRAPKSRAVGHFEPQIPNAGQAHSFDCASGACFGVVGFLNDTSIHRASSF